VLRTKYIGWIEREIIEMKLLQIAAFAGFTTLIVGCGSQPATRSTSDIATPTDLKSTFDCKISNQTVQELCLQAAEDNKQNPQSDTPSDTTTVMAEESPHAPSIGLRKVVKTPTGEVAAQVGCDIRTEHHSVIYAALNRGPQTQAQADYLRNQGLCSE